MSLSSGRDGVMQFRVLTHRETGFSFMCHFGLALLLFVNAVLSECPQGNGVHWRQMWKFPYGCGEACRCIG